MYKYIFFFFSPRGITNVLGVENLVLDSFMPQTTVMIAFVMFGENA